MTKGSTGPPEVDNALESFAKSAVIPLILTKTPIENDEGKISTGILSIQKCQGASGTFSCSLAAKLTWKMPRSKVKVQSPVWLVKGCTAVAHGPVWLVMI